MSLTIKAPKPGEFNNADIAKQPVSFTGLVYGNKSPTDVDLFIEWENKLYIIGEFKYQDAEIPYGQDLALTRLADDLQKSKPTLLIYASHNTPKGKTIIAADATVFAYRYNGNWRNPKPGKQETVKEIISRFVTIF